MSTTTCGALCGLTLSRVVGRLTGGSMTDPEISLKTRDDRFAGAGEDESRDEDFSPREGVVAVAVAIGLSITRLFRRRRGLAMA